ncbi:MAG: Rieske (2Fe-2S) protein [Balneolaceae bacterium]
MKRPDNQSRSQQKTASSPSVRKNRSGQALSTNEIDPVSRKQFLRTAGSTALFAALGIPFTSCGVNDSSGDPTPPPGGGGNGGGNPDSGISVSGDTITIDLTKNDTSTLNSTGGWMLIGAATALVINVDGSVIRSFSSVCPHEGCTTDWSFDGGNFQCGEQAQGACGHGSQFDTDGDLVRGPATSGLTEYTVDRDGDIVTITT